MLLQAISCKLDRTIFWVSISDLMSRFMGESEKMVELLFELAREHQPSLIIIEEVDAVGRKRSSEEQDAERRLKVEFLKQLDSLDESQDEVSFIGSTNLPWELDIAFLRRFEKKLLIPLLSLKERTDMLRGRLSEVSDLSDIEYQKLGFMAKGLTGFEISNFINDVLLNECTQDALSFINYVRLVAYASRATQAFKA